MVACINICINKMKILMFGWELPPKNSGGLGVACFNLTKALSCENAEVIFVLPRSEKVFSCGFRVIFASNNVKIRNVNSLLGEYLTPEKYLKKKAFVDSSGFYGSSLFDEVRRYGELAKKIAKEEKFDVIHAHDWLSFLAGIEAKRVSKKPLVVHIHATEFDRTAGGSVNQLVYEIEKMGMEEADKVIAVSNLTKDIIIKRYGIDKDKIEVVYNAHEDIQIKKHKDLLGDIFKKKIVAFIGRITIQKGPDYFLKAAKKCLEVNKDILFVMAGSGDMKEEMIRRVSEMGMTDNFLFEDFLRGEDLNRLYQSASLFVMPSVSEPFGIMALESIQNGTPVLISKQMGAGEKLVHCLKADFWDIDDMANKILSVVSYEELQECLSKNGKRDLDKFSWRKSAKKCINIYKNIISSFNFK